MKTINGIRTTLLVASCFATLSIRSGAEALNVSKIATGQQHAIDWFMDYFNPINNQGVNFTYFPMATGKISSETASYFDPGSWTAAWMSVPASPHVNRSAPTANYTLNGTQYTYETNSFRQALADMTLATPLVKARTFGTGVAETVDSYTVRVEQTAGSRNVFVSLQHPLLQRALHPGYTNSGQYAYYKPNQSKSRSSVQILVDGLPVWSSENAQIYPGSYAKDAFAQVQTLWGKQLAAGTSVLYLGSLTAGHSMDVTMVIRTSSEVTQTQCAYDFHSNQPVVVRCHDNAETVQLSKLANNSFAMSVYAKTIPVMIQPLPLLTVNP